MTLTDPSLEPGLSLGGFASQAEASQQLESFLQRGVRSAKVVQERSEVRGQLLNSPLSTTACGPAWAICGRP